MRACVYVCAHVGVCIYIPKCYCTAEKNKMYGNEILLPLRIRLRLIPKLIASTKHLMRFCRSNAETLRLSRFSNAVMQSLQRMKDEDEIYNKKSSYFA